MKTGITAALLAALFINAVAVKGADEKSPERKVQTTCPVMGGKINKNLFVDHDGLRIYVCCAGCIAPIKKDPARYVATLAEKGERPAKLQTVCPIMGGKINKKQYVDHGGKRVYVCCPGCIEKIKADPAGTIEKLEQEGIVLEDTPKPEKETSTTAADSHKGYHH